MKNVVRFVGLWMVFCCLSVNVFAESALNVPRHLIRDVPTFSDENLVNVVVEIPAGTLEKWEVDHKDGQLKQEYKNGHPRIIRYLGYPGNYGMIPQTSMSKSMGGDGDPLDVIVIGASYSRGDIAAVRIIGTMKFLDNGERDDKLIGVVPGSVFDGVDSLEQLDESFPGVSSILKTWFLYYKGSGKMVFQGFADPKESMQILQSTRDAYAIQ